MSNISTAAFAAANSGYGFRSFYEQIFNDSGIKKRYIIKGGPGTGKSSFMKTIGKKQEECGRTVEYYLCSSDPDSVDGIVIDGKIAMMDGTAPHTVDTEIAGARDEMIDLLRCCDTTSLEGRVEEIKALSKKKSLCYKRAYGYLSMMLRGSEMREGIVLSSLLSDKIKCAAENTVLRFPQGEGFFQKVALRSSFGMKGRVILDLYEKRAKRIYVVNDSYSLGYKYLEAVVNAAKKKKQPITVSYSYLDPNRLDAVLFDNTGDCFIVLDASDEKIPYGIYKTVNTKRFLNISELNTEKKHEYKAMLRIETEISSLAEKNLLRAGEYHFALEKIYVPCMNFEMLMTEADKISERISKSL
ncbi:MAG: hypothetical protein J6Q78_02245 [Clostridia bacterium]|nr:hypothetical protein [Clostridia bacterium]